MGPAMVVNDQIPNAAPLLSEGNILIMRDWDNGTIEAPTTPWSTLERMSSSKVGEAPHRKAAKVNKRVEISSVPTLNARCVATH